MSSLTRGLYSKKPKLGKSETIELSTEPKPVSSVFDTWLEEDITMCLVMLPREAMKIKTLNMKKKDQLMKHARKFPNPFELLQLKIKANRKKIKPNFEDESNTENKGNVKIYEKF